MRPDAMGVTFGIWIGAFFPSDESLDWGLGVPVDVSLDSRVPSSVRLSAVSADDDDVDALGALWVCVDDFRVGMGISREPCKWKGPPFCGCGVLVLLLRRGGGCGGEVSGRGAGEGGARDCEFRRGRGGRTVPRGTSSTPSPSSSTSTTSYSSCREGWSGSPAPDAGPGSERGIVCDEDLARTGTALCIGRCAVCFEAGQSGSSS